MRTSSLLNSYTGQAQVQGFAPRLQHAVRLLNMSSEEYAQALLEEADRNPFLEVEPPALSGTNAAAQEEADRLSWAAPRYLRPARDEGLDTAAQLARHVDLREHLRAQLGLLRLDSDERACAAAIIDSLDDDGYLRNSLEELTAWGASACEAHGADGTDNPLLIGIEPPDERHWQMALHSVQSLDPCGVGARSLCECLQLQAQQIADADCRALVRTILREHMALLARGSLRQLAARTGATLDAVANAARAIRRMQPKPGATFAQDLAPYVVPEVLVRRQGRLWTASLNEAAFPRLQLDSTLRDWAHAAHSSAPQEARQLLERAEWTVQNLRQRTVTILAVAGEIVARQSLFFEHGAFALKPLEMRDVAQGLGMHASTVSRVVHSKFMATPLGTFELRHFFARSTAKPAFANCAPVALQALLRSIVESESPEKPHSDVQLARLLGQQGFALARRTVTKYRQALRIESVEKRRLGRLDRPAW